MATLKVPVSEADHIQGNQNAPLTLVEYGDYECPHCGRAYFIIKKLQKHFGDQLRFVFRNFPLTQIHPLAEPAAESAEFAGTYDLFWPMHDGIYENQARLSIPLLFEVAAKLNLPQADLRAALANHEYLPKVRSDFMSGVKSGVNGTPTFFINGIRHDGSYEYDDLAAAIDTHLVRAQRPTVA
jgi:protein-disulfide isomerase